MTRNVISVGCIGGSGSRVIAKILQSSGYYIGEDLNVELDNLWFTLFFKRLSVLVEDPDTVALLYDIFYHRLMYGTLKYPETRNIIEALSSRDRIAHNSNWLSERANSFLKERQDTVGKMAWKEPNTHVIVDRLLKIDPDLRYIHITRSGLDMAYSENLNQLRLWGSVFLDRPVIWAPKDALSYWVAVEQRIRRLKMTHPDRILIVHYEDLAFRPNEVIDEILLFCGETDAIQVDKIAQFVVPAHSIGRHKSRDLSDFLPSDIEYAEAISAIHARPED